MSGFVINDPTYDEGRERCVRREHRYTPKLSQIIESINWQPAWRLDADIDADYYDGKQLTNAVLADMEAKGLAPLPINLTKPTIDVVLGMEAKTRTDWKVRADSESAKDLALALSEKLHEAERQSFADRACSDAYAAQIKTGLGWVEVARNSNPLKSPYRVQYVHRREIWWDWLSRDTLLDDARWLLRRRWYDPDHLAVIFPEHADLISHVAANWENIDEIIRVNDTGLARSLEVERSHDIEEMEYRDMFRERLALYELWYKTYQNGFVMMLPNQKVVEFNRDNPRHVEVAVSGQIEIFQAPIERVRMAYCIGPHVLYDQPSPYRHSYFPYTPFFGFREDRTQIPYGLVRCMRPSQDEVNTRHTKEMWLLSTRRVITDQDSVIDHNKTAREVARPDSYVVLNSARKPGSRFDVEDGSPLSEYQFKAKITAAENIQKTAGVYQSMMGDRQPGVTSGKAINALVEQGITTLGEVNDNTRFARQRVGEQLMSLVIEDCADREVEVEVEDRVIVLNERVQDPETGEEVIKNNVKTGRVSVVLDTIPSSPTFRQQLVDQMMTVMQGLPGEVQMLMIDYVIEMSDVPHAKDIADRLRQKLGLSKGGDNKDEQTPPPELAQAEQEIQGLQEKLKEVMQALQAEQQKNMQAKAQVEGLKTEAAKERAQADIVKARVDLQEEQAKIKALQANADEAEQRGRVQAVRDLITGEATNGAV